MKVMIITGKSIVDQFEFEQILVLSFFPYLKNFSEKNIEEAFDLFQKLRIMDL